MAGQNSDGQKVDADELTKSLGDLLKAAGTTEEEALRKGGAGKDSEMDGTAISTSGHVDEHGAVGGGMAGAGDIGSLSSAPWESKMMLAKMMEAGYLSPGPNFAAMAGSDYMDKLQGKMKEEEEEEEMEGKAGGGFVPDSRPSPTKKSFADEFSEDAQIQDGIDASDFMESLTTRTTEALDYLGKSLSESQERQGAINVASAHAVHEMGMLIKSQQSVIQELGHRLGIVEREPAPPKGATSLTGAQAMTKSIHNEVGADSGQSGPFEKLNKSQVARTLSFMNLEKGITQIDGDRTADLVCKAEGGGVISENTLDTVKRFLVTNPNLAERALNYS
jgi:hypothetical protein